MIKKLALSLALAGSFGVVGCTQTEQAVSGAVAGGLIGAAVNDDAVEGAVIGAAVGGVAGTLIGRTQRGDCVYRDARGRRFVAACR